MDFALSEEQEMLQETVHGFVAGECPPPVVRDIFDGDASKVAALWSGLVDMGVAGLMVPEEHGGAGLELLDLALVSECLGRGAVPVPFLGHSLAIVALLRGGSEEQQAHWLPALATGEKLGTVAVAEPGDVWEPDAWKLSVNGRTVTGAKDLVPHVESADLIVVGVEGGRLALVERSAAGVAIEPIDALDATRPLSRLELRETPCELMPVDAASAVRDAGLVLLAADAFGAAFHLVRSSAEYALQREQFGQPIAQFQSVKHQLADMALEVDPTRSLWWYAAHAFDHIPEEAERAAALAKAHITDRAMEVARAAVESHGGLGFTWECDVQIWFKRAMFDRAFLGGPDAHRDRVAALGDW